MFPSGESHGRIKITEYSSYFAHEAQSREPYDDFPVNVTASHHSDKKTIEDMIKVGTIEVSPLAYMRGRTFNDSFIILDEAQNTTIEQMKMFLTRFGHNIKCTITGDPQQSDLFEKNGLEWSLKKLKECELVSSVQFDDEDVVRSKLVKELIKFLR